VTTGRGEGKKVTYRTIIERIQAMIASGALQPGDRLPPERKLAETLGVSRANLRQAFQALAERGLIESRQGDGTYLLAPLDPSGPAEALVEAISEQGTLVQDIVEFRQMIEPQVAALAARRITPSQIDRLKVVVCDQQRALMAGRADDRLDAEFHRLLVENTQNRVLCQVMSTVQAILNESRSTWLQTGERRMASVEGHLRLIDALEAGDEAAAETAMRQHIAEIGMHILGEQQQ
jgi:GntR family transcriptional repressor for pyruvate dehydrogenase complex